MNTSDKNDDNADSLGEEQDQETRLILDSIESFDDVCKTYRPMSAHDLNNQIASESPKSDQEKVEKASSGSINTPRPEKPKSDLDSDSDFTGFLRQTNLHYSQYRIASGEVDQQRGQKMDYRDYSFSEYPICRPSSSWQSSDSSGYDLKSTLSGAQNQRESPTCSLGRMSQDSGYYSHGRSMPVVASGSDETIVNQPREAAQTPFESPCCSKDSCGCCYRMRDPGQQAGCSHGDQGNPGQEQQLMPVPMGIDPSTGFPIYGYTTPGSYLDNAMYSMPVMQQNQQQRGGGGQNNLDIGSTSKASSSLSSSAESCPRNVTSVPSNQRANSADMEAFMQKYQKSLQECYATAQQGIQQSFSNAQAQQYFNNFPQATQQVYSNPNEGPQLMFATPNQGTQQFYDNSNQAFQGMQQAFSSSLGAQQYYTSSILGAQSYFPPSMAMPASNFFGNNNGFMGDSLQNQTVYSSDYKPFANDGNHFNHFPNGIDIGLAPESCPIYGPAGAAGLAEMGTGGQVYGMGGGCEMNMNSYPLSQMSYSSPYSYDMPATSPSHIPATGMSMASPQTQTGNMGVGNPVQHG
ncbi:uncharacterized protein LOC108108442 [Drosophila eugracilis]|uniref:uncharacterized protein LOC108108442 n=1 Tax=Drosophila eugracilis TaxID=29029 RepID=UPI0007E5CCBF|nr:uncharacterized protein LOC108108442 [Drosophila eugracilis]